MIAYRLPVKVLWLLKYGLFGGIGIFITSLFIIYLLPTRVQSFTAMAATTPTMTNTPPATFTLTLDSTQRTTPYATPTQLPTLVTFTPTPSPTATDPVSVENTPMPTPTATATPSPLPIPTRTPTPNRATATSATTPTVDLQFPYVVAELYQDLTSNHFLTGYVAIVNAQEIPIGGMKVVGTFEPGGDHYESTLSKWFLEGYSAPGSVIKSGSVKFEPPGGIMKGTWIIHLENESGERFSDDVYIPTDPDNKKWFFIKFKDITSLPASTAPTPAVRPTRNPRNTPTRRDTPTPYPTPTPVRPAGGWSFINTGLFVDEEEESVVIYGNLLNGTGTVQSIYSFTGIFYDEQGEIVATEDDTDYYVALEIVPDGEKTPFELTIYDVSHVANYNLSVFSSSSSKGPHHDFEFSNLEMLDESGEFCVSGSLQNTGSPLETYLLIELVLYSEQDNVINFRTYEETSLEDIEGYQSLAFEICVDSHDLSVARHTIHAWGQ